MLYFVERNAVVADGSLLKLRYKAITEGESEQIVKSKANAFVGLAKADLSVNDPGKHSMPIYATTR